MDFYSNHDRINDMSGTLQQNKVSMWIRAQNAPAQEQIGNFSEKAHGELAGKGD